jgi:hypothetical protein
VGASTGTGRIDPLDETLAAMPREVQPSRDLWPAICAVLSEPAPVIQHPSRFASSRPWLQLAAGFLLVLASSLTTYFVMQRSLQTATLRAQQEAARQLLQAPAVPVMPASFGDAQTLGAGYVQARASLDAEFKRRVASLPPATRQKLEGDLADLRRAAAEIAATLATHPNHPLLQDLLLSTYQSELALLSSVNDMASATTETRL